jgi:hypothetical protein
MHSFESAALLMTRKWWLALAGWTVVRDDALKLMYRHEPGTTVHCFKARCILDCPLEVSCIE